MAKQAKGKKDTLDGVPFEEVMERLQSVVKRLEEGDLPLERSLTEFEEGIRLSRAGASRLDEAEQRVEQLLADGSGLSTQPLDLDTEET